MSISIAMALLLLSPTATARDNTFKSRSFGPFIVKVPSQSQIAKRSIDAQSALYTVRLGDQNLVFIYVGTKPAFPFFAYGPPDVPAPIEQERILQSVRPVTVGGSRAQLAEWTNGDGTYGRDLLIPPVGGSKTALQIVYNRLSNDARKVANVVIDSTRRKSN